MTNSSIARGVRGAGRVAVVAVAISACLPTSLAAQAPPGWVFNPGVSVAETWDNNVVLTSDNTQPTGDFLTAVTPRAALGFRGRQTTFQVNYLGTFSLYQELSDLNSYDHRSNSSYRYRLTPTLTFLASNSLSRSPTTDEVNLPGVIFRRQGVIMSDFRSGFEARLSSRSSLKAAYVFQWVNFDDEHSGPPSSFLDRSGHAHGAEADYNYVLTPRLSVGAEYDLRRANVGEIRTFDTQNAMGTVDYRLGPRYSLSAGAGLSWLHTTSVIDDRQSAPAFRVSLDRTGQRLGWNVGYRKSFLPAVGFGGTFQNQEFQAGFFATLARRLQLSANVAVTENDALRTSELGLRSTWARSSMSYAATRFLRIEGFYTAAFQNSQRPGGRLNRSRAGVLVATSTRMRIR